MQHSNWGISPKGPSTPQVPLWETKTASVQGGAAERGKDCFPGGSSSAEWTLRNK